MSFRQLRALGIPASTIAGWRRVGWLHPVERGVYAIGHTAPSLRGTLMAAVLAVGEDAYISHVSAGLLWELIRIARPDKVDVTSPRRLPDRARIRTHWTRNPQKTHHHNVPVATPLQTVLDLATCLTQDWLLRRAASQALIAEHFDLDALRHGIAASPGHRGAARLQRLLPALDRTRSGLEDRVLDLVAAQGLPRPLVNARVLGYEVDLLWAEYGVIVEIDGSRYHANPFAAHADRAKQTALEAAGYCVLRIGESDLPRLPRSLAAALSGGATARPA